MKKGTAMKVVCAWCKTIMKDSDGTRVSHGCCDECKQEHFSKEKLIERSNTIHCQKEQQAIPIAHCQFERPESCTFYEMCDLKRARDFYKFYAALPREDNIIPFRQARGG